MNASARHRFITTVTVLYAFSALAWLFLSDELLSAFPGFASAPWLPSVKIVSFVVASAALLFWCLRAVPDNAVPPGKTLIDALIAGVLAQNKRWVLYAFAATVTVGVLLLRLTMPTPFDERPMLIMFMIPIVLSATLGGFGPGMLATLLAALATHHAVRPLFTSGHLSPRPDVAQWSLLVANGIAVSLLSEMLRMAKARAEAKSSLLQTIVSGTSDAVFAKDLRGRYVLVNEAAAQFVGRPAEDILGRNDAHFLAPETARALMESDRAIVASGRTQHRNEQLALLDGTNLAFAVTKGPILTPAGKALGLFGISRDVTAEKQAAAALQEREKRLARVIEGSDQGYWDWNLQTQAFSVSARWETMLGYAPGEMAVSADNWRDIVHPEDLAAVQAAIQQHTDGETASLESEFRARTRSGEWRWILMRGRIVEHSPDGQPLMMSGTHTDVTERKVFEIAQNEASTVFTSSYEGIMVVSPQMRITKVNPAFTRITGYSAEDIYGKSPKVLSSGRQDVAFYRAMWDSMAQHDFWRGEIWNRRKNGELFAELLSISTVRDPQGVVQYYVGVFSDISQLKAHESELDRIAHFDPLTGTPNRRLLGDRLEQAILRSSRSEGMLAVCFLDLDGFKHINDSLGHAAGDALLVAISANLQHGLRADDTLARLGGDEFVILLSNIATAQECAQILERVLQAARAPIAIGDQSICISASIGVTLYPADKSDADTLLRHADQAMYQAKQSGRNRYVLFDPEIDRKAQMHRKTLDVLRQALQADEFVLHYQPKVNLLNGALVGVEALIRWQHPERGLLPPGEFLPFFDGTDLEKPLGEWVIHTALTQALAWSQQGLEVRVSANISAAHLLHPAFYVRLQELLQQNGPKAAQYLELEVLETAALSDMELAATVLQRCRLLGVSFALDDFGTGYSSLTYLRKLPVDLLKIDQSFIRDMLVDVDDLGIVEGVIRLADVFKRDVIAEGVETLAHGVALLRMGCHLVQGYGIAKPMPAQELLPWLGQWHTDTAWQGLRTEAPRPTP
ncbi:MAG: EAL domain-containing protein [Pseudomonadota bacterium]